MSLTSDDLKAIASLLNSELAPIQNDISDINSRLTNVETTVSNINTRLSNVETKIDNVEQRLDGVEQGLDNVETKLDEVNTRLTKVENEVKYISVNQLENNVIPRLDTIESCYVDASKDFIKRSEQIDDMQQTISIQGQVITEHSEQIQELQELQKTS